ncbi:MAG: hypothetical protein C4523_14295 [Myxococcales bacterium]|nr:MAG: hypothetical protein C4523_14295 [Myxococcales bacterium]
MERTTTIEVFACDDGGHIVQVAIADDGKEVGTAQLPGGDYENAVAMAEGLKHLADRGVDLTAMLPAQEVGR